MLVQCLGSLLQRPKSSKNIINHFLFLSLLVFMFYSFDIFLMSLFEHVILGDIYFNREYGRQPGKLSEAVIYLCVSLCLRLDASFSSEVLQIAVWQS